MRTLLLTVDGRIPRSRFWLAVAVCAGLGAVTGLVLYGLWLVIPGTADDGNVRVEGVTAIPYVLVVFGDLGVCTWAGICVNAKRCHDRGRSGWFQRVQVIPLIGAPWYLVECGILRGTTGPNRYGPDPLDAPASIPHRPVSA